MATKCSPSSPSSRSLPSRGRGWQSLASFAAPVARSAAARRGFSQSTLLLHWHHIIGHELAQISAPVRLARSRGGQGGVLHIAVDGMYTVLLQHRTPYIIERVNTYLGGPAVDRVTFQRRRPTGPTLHENP